MGTNSYLDSKPYAYNVTVMSATRKLQRAATAGKRRDKRREERKEAKKARLHKLIQERNHIVARRSIRETQKQKAAEFNKAWERQLFSWRAKLTDKGEQVSGRCVECGAEDVDLFYGTAHIGGERVSAVDICQKCAIELEELAK